jgi:hypothetical protein
MFGVTQNVWFIKIVICANSQISQLLGKTMLYKEL